MRSLQLRNLKRRKVAEIYPRAKGISFRLLYECPINEGVNEKRRSTRIAARYPEIRIAKKAVTIIVSHPAIELMICRNP
jgi:hypothetical protein